MSNGINEDTNFGRQDGVDLKTYFSDRISSIFQLIAEKDKNYNQRFDNVIEATKNALAAADRAVSKAETATEKRFEGVNEFRNTLADQQRTLMPRSEVEILIKSLNEKVDALNIATIAKQSQGAGRSEGIGQIIAIAGFVSIVVGLISRFIK